LGWRRKWFNPQPLTKCFTPCPTRLGGKSWSDCLSGPATVSELAAPFDMQLPSFVQHLSVLEQSRLVRSKKRGRVRTYEIAPERFKVVEDWLTARRQLWEARLDRFDQHVKQLKEKESES
jgi:DNA-binding transcriptional ArsR family regulator